jgi:hypothetical protein
LKLAGFGYLPDEEGIKTDIDDRIQGNSVCIPPLMKKGLRLFRTSRIAIHFCLDGSLMKKG